VTEDVKKARSLALLVLATAITTPVATSSVAGAAGLAPTAMPRAGVQLAATTCPYPVASTRPTGTTAIAAKPARFDTTDGDILAATTFQWNTTHLLVIGGTFANVITPDGVRHPARNFAVISEESGNLAYAGTNVNGSVRAVGYSNGVIYAGGDFTTFNGLARNHVAAVTAPNGGVSGWNPGYPAAVYALAAGTSAIYFGGAGSTVRAVSPTTAASVWSDTVSGGPVRVLLLSPGQTGLYIGGLFEQVSTLKRHGLVEVYARTGAPVTTFAPILRADSGIGPKGSYDGEEALSLAWDTSYSPARLILGYGGATRNGTAPLNPATGAGYWNHHIEGDAQGEGVAGNIYVTGYHRNHGNNIGCPYPYFATAVTAGNGTILSYWDPKLSGNQSNADGGNNGVQAITVDRNSKKVFLLGAFTTYGATCDYATLTCTGGTPLKSIAVFPYA